jgi:transposase
MPYTTEKSALKDPFLDRRCKLIPCQKEMVVYWYKVQGSSINSIAKMFRVNKRLIQFILFPERQKKNVSLRQDRGGSKIYYNRQEHNEAMKGHRTYKHKTLKDITSRKR